MFLKVINTHVATKRHRLAPSAAGVGAVRLIWFVFPLRSVWDGWWIRSLITDIIAILVACPGRVGWTGTGSSNPDPELKQAEVEIECWCHSSTFSGSLMICVTERACQRMQAMVLLRYPLLQHSTALHTPTNRGGILVHLPVEMEVNVGWSDLNCSVQFL